MFGRRTIPDIQLSLGQSLPWGYGIAYHNNEECCMVLYPWPWNRLVRVLRRWYRREANAPLSQDEQSIEDAWDSGFRIGYKQADEHWKRLREIEAENMKRLIERERDGRQ